ncbi:TetR family transcriptional regulator [Streptosporangium sp. NPDC000396]|uniref:TetR family transcriptional regulator n=1 Tax=Streptosporangium sp. NPDC000396 TaxID=3366185 RepID=UPI0036C43D58
MAAAAQTFAEQGFAGASVDEIASRAGHTVGALYSHFTGKTTSSSPSSTSTPPTSLTTWRKSPCNGRGRMEPALGRSAHIWPRPPIVT